MTTEQLYAYIDERIKTLTELEVDARNNFQFDVVSNCIVSKSELLDMKLFIQSQS